MKFKKFKLWHLFAGTIGLLAVEALLVWLVPAAGVTGGIIIVCAIVGAVMNIYVSIQAIEEVRSHSRVLVFLSIVVAEFIAFFTLQYACLLSVAPASFPTLAPDAISLLLHSTMIFIFNPIYQPATSIGRALLLINTLSALGLVLFVLQNMWQLRLDQD